VAADAWDPGQPVDHESPSAPTRFHAQKKTLIAREQDAAERAAWRQALHGVDPTRLLFLDETSTPTTLTPRYAWAPCGDRAVGRVPRGRWQSITLLATLSPTGMGPSVVLEGALDRATFETYVAELLVPTLRPGQIVICDNLSVHKSAHARQMIAAAGAEVWFLPRYSPDYNPIELAFAKLKQALRRAQARTSDTVVTAIGTAYQTITAHDAQGFFQAAGYPL
jgi:transposase